MTASSDDRYPRSRSYLALLEGLRQAGAGKLKGKYASLSWNDLYKAAERLDDQRGTSRLSTAIFDRIFALTLDKARNEMVLKSMLAGGRVLFVTPPCMAKFTAKPASAKAMTDAQLRAVARRLARR